MSKGIRITSFFIFAILIATIYWVFGTSVDVPQPVSILLFSSLLLLAFTSYFIEHYFARPADVVAASISILLALAPMKGSLSKFGIWYEYFFIYTSICAFLAIVGLLLADRNYPEGAIRNVVASVIAKAATTFGNGRFLFFSLFFLCLIFYVDSQSVLFLVLAAYGAIQLLVNPQRFLVWMAAKSQKKSNDELGAIIGVQSKNTFIARLLPEHNPVKRFDFVQFRYSMTGANDVIRGLIVDNYLLNEEQWIKILRSSEIDSLAGDLAEPDSLKENVIYKFEARDTESLLKRFVGVVMEGSEVSKIRFEYGHKVVIEEGALLGIKCNSKTVLYQVVAGRTDVELLQSKNESGLIIGEAIQLGWWDADSQCFKRYGWVPEMNAPVLLIYPEHESKLADFECEIGHLPNTKLPVIFNLDYAVTHHLAVLGVTGSGKSVFVRDLIRRICAQETKVICIDFTMEYAGKFKDLGATQFVSQKVSDEVFTLIDELSKQLAEFDNKKDHTRIAKIEEKIMEVFETRLIEFMGSEEKICIFELPEVSNSGAILEYTRRFFKGVFSVAKARKFGDKKLCIVLEEAHTVIPEWSFSGSDDKRSQTVVNSISQIALQGRKYGVGFVVVAQRTANVSKTVLTQCNSVVAFRQFDRTGSEFLSNYVGQEMLGALPTLKERNAIVAGKALRGGTPVIFEVPEIVEEG